MAKRISLHLTVDDLAIIDQAARRRGQSRSEFIREAAVRAADTVILEHSASGLSPEGFAALRATGGGPKSADPASR